MNYQKPLIRPEQIEQAILLIRGQRVFEAIHRLTTPPAKLSREMGFHIKEGSVPYRMKRK